MNIDYQIIAAQPESAKAKKSLSDAVMARVSKKDGRSWFVGLLHKSPAFVVAIILVSIVTLSGVAYAISYIWPQLSLNVSSPKLSSSGRKEVSVVSTTCSNDVANRNYELKQNATITEDEIAPIVAAECNRTAIQDWASSTYPKLFGLTAPSVDKQFEIGMISAPKTVAAVSADAMTVVDTDGTTRTTLQLEKDTKFIVDHQYKTWRDLQVGDAIEYVSKLTYALDCRATGCAKADSEAIIAVVTLDQAIRYYNLFGSLVELAPCSGNPNDTCHTGNIASIDIYTDDNAWGRISGGAMAQIEGVIQSFTASSVTLETSSKRIVTLTTSYDVITDFNQKRAREYAQYSVGKDAAIRPGDSLAITYVRTPGHSNDTSIQLVDTAQISLLLEIVHKGDALKKF